MREELVNFRIKPSRFVIFSAALFIFVLIATLFYARIDPGIKLVILIIITLIIIINYWKTDRFEEVDFLTELDEMIIRKGTQSQLVKVKNLQNFGYLLLKFTLRTKNKTIPLLIFYDSLDKITYKKLMRLAKWKNYPQKHN